MQHRKDKKGKKSAESKRDRKKHKKRHHDSDGSSSEGGVQAEAPTWPWHRMAFDLVDGINGYGGATPDSRTLLGMASDGSAAVDMSEYTRLVEYLRTTFQINAELRVVLRVPVRYQPEDASLRLHSPPCSRPWQGRGPIVDQTTLVAFLLSFQSASTALRGRVLSMETMRRFPAPRFPAPPTCAQRPPTKPHFA